MQQEIRDAVRCLRRTGHHPGQFIRRPLRRPAILHFVAPLLRDCAVLRRIGFGKYVVASADPLILFV